MDYKDYNIHDFLEDESFIRWVLNTTPEEDEFWRNFENENPGKKELINKSK